MSNINGSSEKVSIWIPPNASDEWREELWWEVHLQVSANLWNFSDGLPHYTGSVDGALRLVPEGWCWLVQHIKVAPTEESDTDIDETICEIWIPAQNTQGLAVERYRVDAPTAPLAICISCVKALEARDG